MEQEVMISMGKLGAAGAIAFAAFGSALGVGTAGAATVGAWKKCYATNRSAPFILMTFVGAPLSQTIYGMILMNTIIKAAAESPMGYPAMIGAGIFGGLAMGASSWFQGIVGAAAADAFNETGKGFGNYLMAIGTVETVALFVMVFIMGTIG